MGIFLVRDEYTDLHGAAADIGNSLDPALSYVTHTPVALGAGKVVLMTNKVSATPAVSVPQARIYTLTDTTWTRGNPTTLPWTSDYAKARATTLEGHVVTQSDNGHYNIIEVAGDTLTPHAGPAYAGGAGLPATAPDAMTRMPGSNAFLAWRYYPASISAWIDVFGVTGTTIQGKSSISLPLPGYGVPDPPRQIIPISNNEAITALMMPVGDVRLVHITFTGSLVSVSTQDISGFTYTPDLSLFASLTHQAEMIVRFDSSSQQLRRYGIDFDGTQFVLTAMPLTQLAIGLTPDDYHPRSTTASVRNAIYAQYLATGGALYVARIYVDDGHDDNWVLLTQYDQDTGTILDQVWAKGDQNGAAEDTLYIDDLTLAFDTDIGELIVGATEVYQPQGQAVGLASARLGTWRVTYTLGEARRSHRASFEP